MLGYVINKLLRRKWMAISLIIGNLLLVGMVVGNLVYSNAVLNRVLVKDLNNYMNETGVYPIQSRIEIRMDKTRSDQAVAKKVNQLEQMTANFADSLGLTTKEHIARYFIRTNYIEQATDKEDSSYVLDLCFISDLAEHSTMLSGNMYSNEIVDGAIEVVVSRKTMMEHGLMVGKEWYLADIKDDNGKPYKARVVGVFQPDDIQDAYWVENPDTYGRHYFMDETLFRDLFVDYDNPKVKWSSAWNVLVDYDNIKAEQVPHILETIKEFTTNVKAIDVYKYDEYFQKTLEDFQIKQIKLENILFLLEIPIFILLIIFIYMVNNQLMLLERNDIAILKSRGASNKHVILIYLYQGLIISGLGLILGIPLGLFFCYALGNANAFMEFVSRTALPIELTMETIMVACLCTLLSLSITLVLAFLHTRETIVSYKRKMSRRSSKKFLWSFAAGAATLSVAFYGLYSFNLHSADLASASEAGGGMDPLLFCSSIFFIIGAAFFVQGIFPFIVRFIFQLGKNFWSPSAYAAFQQVVKGSDNQGFIILFIILTVSLGIYDANLARTINGNEESRIQYSIGADIVVQEKWESNKDAVESFINTMRNNGQTVDESSFSIYYVEPDFNRYNAIEGIESTAKVYINNDMDVSVNKGKIKATLMGINTREFGQTAVFKTDLLEQHWYHYLNEMSTDENGIIVSSNFQKLYGYKIGDVITYSDKLGSNKGVIRGFVDYWPSYVPVAKESDKDGVVKELDQFLIIGHLAKIQAIWGITPYQVWMKAEGSTSVIYDFAEKNNLEFEYFKDLSASIIEKNNNPFYQGTNGVLTLGFIIILLVCAVGFLIFWVFSILSRTLQFGVFRAMGMTLGEIIAMLLREQFFLSVIPITLGLVIGHLVSKLFVPLIQIAYTSADQIIPLEIINLQSDQVRVIMIVGVMVVLCIGIIAKLVSNLKITQALKLGED